MATKQAPFFRRAFFPGSLVSSFRCLSRSTIEVREYWTVSDAFEYFHVVELWGRLGVRQTANGIRMNRRTRLLGRPVRRASAGADWRGLRLSRVETLGRG